MGAMDRLGGENKKDKHVKAKGVLETPEVAEMNERERQFMERGGFRDLVRLKIAVEALKEFAGLLIVQNNVNSRRFLEDKKNSLIEDIDKYLGIIIQYQTATGSQALERLQQRLEDCKKSLTEEDWDSYIRQAIAAQGFFIGMNDVLRTFCGVNIETAGAKKALKA